MSIWGVFIMILTFFLLMAVVNIALVILYFRPDIADKNLGLTTLTVGQTGTIKSIYRDDRLAVEFSSQSGFVEAVCELVTMNKLPRAGDSLRIISISGCYVYVEQVADEAEALQLSVG